MNNYEKKGLNVKGITSVLLYAFVFLIPLIAGGNPLFNIGNTNGIFISEVVIALTGLITFNFGNNVITTIKTWDIKQWIVILGALFYIVINIVTTFTSINMFESELYAFIYFNGFLLLISTYFILDREKLYNLLFILVLSSAVIAIYGIYQTGFWYKHIAENTEILSWDILETAKNTFRAMGTFIHPNVMAGFLLMVIPVAYMLLMIKKNKSLLFLMAFIVTLGLFVTYSRAAIGLYVVSLPFIFIVLKKEIPTKNILGYLSGVIASAVIVLIFLVSSYNHLNRQTLYSKYAPSKITTVNDMSFIVRKDLAIGAIDIIKHHTWLGTGPGTFNIAYRMYQQGAIYSKYAHNNYLEMASEIGIPGLVTFLIFILGILLSLGSAWKDGSMLAGILLVSMALFIIHTFVDFDYASPAVVWCLFLYAGLSLILTRKDYAH